MSPADSARRSLEVLITAQRGGDPQTVIDARRAHKASIRDLARAAHRGHLAAEPEPGLFASPEVARAAIAAMTALRLGHQAQDPALLREYDRIVVGELLADAPAAVMALLGIGLLLMGEDLSNVAYVLGLEQVQS